jgi:hypothetical protein
MKNTVTILLLLFIQYFASAQVKIGGTAGAANASAVLEVESTNKGLLLPRLTSAERKAIANPATGLLVFDVNLSTFMFWDGFQWRGFVPEAPASLPPTTISITSPNGSFGTSVDMQGNFAIVGNYYQRKAYLFELSNNAWLLRDTLKPLTGTTSDFDNAYSFGSAVAISDNFIAIGAPEANSNIGAVYLFKKAAGKWVTNSAQKVVISNFNGQFGTAIDLTDNMLAVGSPNFSNARGAVFFFNVQDPNMMNTYFTAASSVGGDRMGTSVAISGNHVAVGWPYATVNALERSGKVTFYEKVNGSFQFLPAGELTSFLADMLFGYSVALDGDACVIGAPKTHYTNTYGHIQFADFTNGSWQQRGGLMSDAGADLEAAIGDHFGYSVAFKGGIAIVGSNKTNVANSYFTIFKYNGFAAADPARLRRVYTNQPVKNSLLGEQYAVATNGTQFLAGLRWSGPDYNGQVFFGNINQ